MKIGEAAPDFELYSQVGEKIKLTSYFGKKKVILFFYVKDNTPGCTAEVKGITDTYPKISDKYEIIGINHDSVQSHKKFCQKLDVPFRILSDPDKKIATLYGAKGALGMYTKRMTFLIGLDGKIENITHGMGASPHTEFVKSLTV